MALGNRLGVVLAGREGGRGISKGEGGSGMLVADEMWMWLRERLLSAWRCIAVSKAFMEMPESVSIVACLLWDVLVCSDMV